MLKATNRFVAFNNQQLYPRQENGFLPSLRSEASWTLRLIQRIRRGIRRKKQMKLYLNGELIKDLDDPKKPTLTGGVGLATYQADVIFDDVRVNGPGIPGAAVEPSSKLAITWAHLKAQ